MPSVYGPPPPGGRRAVVAAQDAGTGHESPHMTDESTPQRKRPVHGVLTDRRRPTIVFLTVCTKHRAKWLASPEIHRLLRSIWEDSSSWLVGRYILMPDHIHLFAGPGSPEVSLEKWVRYWKTAFRNQAPDRKYEWQDEHWDTRLRRRESYDSKWEYVRSNPVRHALVGKAEDWPYQGEINVLSW
jgi:putative transposase